MRIVVTPTALAEIDEILSYVEERNPRAAADIAAALERTIALIAKRPESAPFVFEKRIRAKLVE
jgi:plasmid stabilization system protein ParE